MAFYEFPFSSRENKFSVHYRLGIGTAYLSKCFDPDQNNLNLVIGSKLNGYVDFKLNVKYKLNTFSEMSTGIGFTHCSNGNIKSPNLGLNSATLSLGYSHSFYPVHQKKPEPILEPNMQKFVYELILSAGTKNGLQLNRESFFVSSLVLDSKYNFNLKYSMGVGLDFFYDQALGPNKLLLENEEYSNADCMVVLD